MIMTNKTLLAVGVVALIGLTIVGFTQTGGSVLGSSTSDITFGALAPLTGPAAVLGENMRNGMELAREDAITKHSLNSFAIKYEDACDGTSTTDAVTKLVNIDQVRVIASSFCIVGLDAVMPITEENKVIVFNTAANPEPMLGKQYVFSTNFTIRNDAARLAEYARGQGAERAGIIHFATSFGESYRDNFTDTFVKSGGVVTVSEGAGISQTDFRTSLTKIKATNPDVLVLVHFGASLGSAIKQARELGIAAPIIGDYESEDPTVLEYAGIAAEGFVISSSQPDAETNAVSDFARRYEERYGKAPDVLATNAYDSVMLQADAYISCAGDTDCMKAELEKVANYDGVSGRVTINPEDHSVEKPNVFKVVRNGKFEMVK